MNSGAVATSVTMGMGEGARSAPETDGLRAHTYSLLGALLAAPPPQSLIQLLTRITPAEVGGGDELAAAWAKVLSEMNSQEKAEKGVGDK